MKIQLDTEKQTIKLEDSVLLSDLVKTLTRLLPNGEWKKFTLETHTVIEHWSSPIVIERYTKPYWQPWYYYSSNTNVSDSNIATAEYKSNSQSFNLKSGVYNIEA
jgi:hypothetical protein